MQRMSLLRRSLFGCTCVILRSCPFVTVTADGSGSYSPMTRRRGWSRHCRRVADLDGRAFVTSVFAKQPSLSPLLDSKKPNRTAPHDTYNILTTNG